MRAILRLLLWLLAFVAVGAAMIALLFAQTQDEGSARARSEDLTQSSASIQGSRWALLIGVADYSTVEGSEIKQLKAPVKNVNALAAFLKDPKKSGFDVDHIFALTDEQATRRKILMGLNDIVMRAAPEDTVIFYFSGGGIRHGEHGTTYLVPHDSDLRDIETTCIGFEELAVKIRKMRAGKVVIIVDASYSGGFKPESARAVARQGIAKRYLEALQRPAGRAMLLSSDESEVSWEDDESGVFTRFLLEGLNGKADANKDGIITFTEVALYVEETVPKYARENFPQVQMPTRRYDLGQVRGDIPLAINRSNH